MATETVAFRIDADTKQTWQIAAEESDEYASLSHLVRRAVNRELSDDFGPSANGDGSSGEIIGAVESIEERLSDVESGLSGVREELRAESTVPDSVRTDAYSALPETVYEAKKAAEIADEIGENERLTDLALTELRQSLNTIRVTTTEDGDIQYYQEE